jgi:hypothetical protein
MFEQALVLRAGVEKHVDLGLLAETIFFYGNTHLLLNRGSIEALASQIPAAELIELFDRDAIKLSYIREGFVVLTAGFPRVHQVGFAHLHSEGVGKKKLDYREEIAVALERRLGKSAETRKLAKAVGDRVKLHRMHSDESGKCLPVIVRRDLANGPFVKKAVVTTLGHLVPTYKQPQFHFNLFDTGSGFAVDTNLDFEAINKVYHQTIPPSHSSIDVAYLLSHIYDARADIFFAAYYMAEPVTTPVYSDISRIVQFDFIRRRSANIEELDQFLDVAVPDSPSIRETINEKRRTFAEFLKLLDEAEKFKKWLQVTNPDAGLLQEYYNASTAKQWTDKVPSKTVRFAIVTGIAAALEAVAPSGVGTVLGFGAAAVDQFALDQLLKGWRPNQFIVGPYQEFVSGTAEAAEEHGEVQK